MSGQAVSTVTFLHPFLLPGMEGPHQAGTFSLTTELSELDVWWPAYRSAMTIMLPVSAAIEAYPVTRSDLDAALAADAKEASP